MHLDPGRCRRTPTACPARPASRGLYGYYRRENIRFPAGDRLRKPDRPPESPHAFRGGWKRSLTPSTSVASPGTRRVSERMLAPCVRAGPPVRTGAKPTLKEAHAGRRWSSHSNTGRPGTAPLAWGSAQKRHHPEGLFLGSHNLSIAGSPLQAARLIHESSEADVIHQPQSQKTRPDTGTTGAKERQRNAGHWHQARHHSHINHHVEQQ